MSGAMNGTHPRRTLRILDLAAFVVGFGLAAQLTRALGAGFAEPSLAETGVIGFVYLWLGLAMSGPIVLVLDRRAIPRTHLRSRERRRIGSVPAADPDRVRRSKPERSADDPAAPDALAEAHSGYSRAELAWLSIGSYWFFLACWVVPSKLPFFALIQIVMTIGFALSFWFTKPTSAVSDSTGTPWTHWAAVAVLASWPFAWAAMILLTNALP
jgi:hypothetical protein